MALWVLRAVAGLGILWLPAAAACSSFSAAGIGMLPGAAPTQAYVSETPGLNDLWYNPAGLGYIKRLEAAGGYMDYLSTIKGGMAGLAGAAGGGLGYALYLSYLSTGSVTRTDYDDPTGGGGESFTFGELVGGVSAGKALAGAASAGAGLKFAREQADEDFTTGLLADLGVAVRLYGSAGWPGDGHAAYFNGVVRNLLLTGGDGDAGSAQGVEGGFSLAGAGATPFSGGISFYAGRRGLRELRAGLVGQVSQDFRARLGYRRRVGENSDSSAGYTWVRGLTAGFGVRFGGFWLDYTYEDSSPLDAIHRFAFTFSSPASH